MPRRPTIYDVAERAGVSKSLVSLVLRDSPKVSPARRAAVERAIAELGYRPSRLAASLAARRSRSIGVIIDDFENPWFVDLLAGMRRALADHGYHVSVADAALNAHLGLSALEGFVSLDVDGVVIASEQSLDGAIRVPHVVAGNRTDPPAAADIVADDDTLGAAMAVEHLAGLGHRTIGHLAADSGPGALRREAFLDACRARGLQGVLTAQAHPTSERAGRTAADQLLDHRPELTAVFAANDVMALGALSAARERGLRVPQDLSVIGYDDVPLAGSAYIDLSTVDNMSAEVGEAAAAALLDRIDGAGPSEPVRRLIPPRLVARGTTGPAPGSRPGNRSPDS